MSRKNTKNTNKKLKTKNRNPKSQKNYRNTLKIRRKNAAKTKASKRSEIVVLTISLLLFTSSIGGSMFKHLTREKIATMIVPYGSVDIPLLVSGIIIRNETVYDSPTSGEVVYVVADGEKVRNGSMICSIEDIDTSSVLQAQAEQLSQKIFEMQDLRGEISSVSSEVNLINTKIKNEIDNNLLKLSLSDNKALYNLKEHLDDNLNLRNDMLLNENVGAVKPYVNEYRQYSGKLDESRAPIYAKSGGIVSYILDGYEDALNFDNMHEITKEQTSMTVDEDFFITSRTVNSGDNVFKIIESSNWYIASYIDNELIFDWKENSSVRLFLEKDGDYKEHVFKVDTLRQGEKESFVLLKSDRQVSDYADMRSVSFKTFNSVYSGIKIPETAICERTFLKIPLTYVSDLRDNKIVNKKNGNLIEQVIINAKTLRGVEYEEDYVYIMQDFDNIRRGDTIVMDESDETGYVISEIATSKGVFKTNNGLAVFVSIDTEGMVEGNKGYVILNSDNNGLSGGLKIYDRIISDATSNFIREGTIIN